MQRESNHPGPHESQVQEARGRWYRASTQALRSGIITPPTAPTHLPLPTSVKRSGHWLEAQAQAPCKRGFMRWADDSRGRGNQWASLQSCPGRKGHSVPGGTQTESGGEWWGPQGLPNPTASSKPLSECCWGEGCQARTLAPGTSMCPETQFSCHKCNLETNKSNKHVCPLPFIQSLSWLH